MHHHLVLSFLPGSHGCVPDKPYVIFNAGRIPCVGELLFVERNREGNPERESEDLFGTVKEVLVRYAEVVAPAHPENGAEVYIDYVLVSVLGLPSNHAATVDIDKLVKEQAR